MGYLLWSPDGSSTSSTAGEINPQCRNVNRTLSLQCCSLFYSDHLKKHVKSSAYLYFNLLWRDLCLGLCVHFYYVPDFLLKKGSYRCSLSMLRTPLFMWAVKDTHWCFWDSFSSHQHFMKLPDKWTCHKNGNVPTCNMATSFKSENTLNTAQNSFSQHELERCSVMAHLKDKNV